MAGTKSEITALPGAFSLLRPSWAAIKLNLVTFLEFVIIEAIIQLVSGVIAAQHPGSANVLNFAANLASLLIATGLVILRLRSVRGDKVDLSEAIRDGLPFVLRYFLLSICIAFLVIVGLILLIVPGIIMMRRYYLAPFYLIDKKMGVFEAMRTSAQASKQYSDSIYGVFGVMLLFLLLCFVLVGFALLMMYYCADALRYEQIRSAIKD
jgi:hypothetical protein